MAVATSPIPFPDETLAIVPLVDPVVEQVGFDPRSAYVEEFWLSVLGPSTTLLVRRIAAGLEADPDGFLLDLTETAQALGLGERQSRHSPFARALVRCVHFEVAEPRGQGVLAVRRKLPPLSYRQLQRLPASLQSRHEEWRRVRVGRVTGPATTLRARHLALSLLELGESEEATARQLDGWSYPPSVARDAAGWAWDRHRSALAAAKAAAASEAGLAGASAHPAAGPATGRSDD